MTGLKDTLARIAEARQHLQHLTRSHASEFTTKAASQHAEVIDFGANPGNLRMLTHVPAALPPGAPLVVALHGCTQTAAAYDIGSGWSTLADRHGFAVVFPEQQQANNANRCFNWFVPGDIRRGEGEAQSIRSMIEHAVTHHRLDRRRIHVVGLSAGGAMAASMLAVYPDVFASGAIIAGLRHGAATSMSTAFEAMSKGSKGSVAQSADLVRAASPHTGPWPRISVWHGSADSVVNPANAEQTVDQWCHVHALGEATPVVHSTGAHTRRAWHGQDGNTVIESHTIRNMSHGVPIATGSGIGRVAPFHIDVGISSTETIAGFWGLATSPAFDAKLDATKPARADVAHTSPARPHHGRAAVDSFDPRELVTATLKSAGLIAPAGASDDSHQSVITRTLRSVGLLKE